MQFHILLKYFIPLVIAIFFSSCGGEHSKSEDFKILNEFSKLHLSTQKFFDRDAKMQCACLKENQTDLKNLLVDSKALVDSIKTRKISLDSPRITKIIEQDIYGILANYNQCISDSPSASKEVMQQVQSDMRSFSGASEPGGASHNKMISFNNALMRKHCPTLQKLGKDINELSVIITQRTSE